MDTIRTALASLAILGALGGAAQAEGVRPTEGQTIDLGSMTGSAYYTVQPDGYHVVATLADQRSGLPVRMEGTLASGQRMVISTPGGRSGPPRRVEIRRQDELVEVRPINLTN